MRLGEIISFHRDLLFQGAVQLGWFKTQPELADKAAAHFIFHGPDYHGALTDDMVSWGLPVVDTASFTKEISERLILDGRGDPFLIGIAGYGTGKSHLALTLSTLFSRPDSDVAQKILDNLALADAEIGQHVSECISTVKDQPFLVVALNGMEDFNLASKISSQILDTLKEQQLDTSVLEKLRPRFELAENFVRSFQIHLTREFAKEFGPRYDVEDIVDKLKSQYEDVFEAVNRIYMGKMGTSIPAGSSESLHDFISAVSREYCGEGKPFAGLFIVFDEFGRYIEFAVQKPHVAGPAALQQLFEAVQENSENVFMLSFIQTELKAYASRVMPERREDIERYITRFDSVRKVRLSSNLETVIANLIEKKNPFAIHQHLAALDVDDIHSCMVRWFPEFKGYSLWYNRDTFSKVIVEGCWPLHPLATWVLHKLTTAGRSFQQRSALSLLAQVMDQFMVKELRVGQTIRPVDLVIPDLISEFEDSERTGLQTTVTDAYLAVTQKYQHELDQIEMMLLKAILLQRKTGLKVQSRDDYVRAISMFCGLDIKHVQRGFESLEKEYGVLDWNGLLNQYEIVADAVPRKTFLAYLDKRVKDIGYQTRADIFTANYKKWFGIESYPTDFGKKNDIYTKEWNYNVSFANVSSLEMEIEAALRRWQRAIQVDVEKGQLIYCYVGPVSGINAVKTKANQIITEKMGQLGLDPTKGASLAILFLDDYEGKFGQCLAEYWVLERGLSGEEMNKFENFIVNSKASAKENIESLFSHMAGERNLVFATQDEVTSGPLSLMLEGLFDVVYPERIPFPFDAFHTSRGNAAKYCQVFCRELLSGNLDREWLATKDVRMKNRGYQVLDRSWQLFGKSGSVLRMPKNRKVANLLKILDLQLQSDDRMAGQVNLGETVRTWLAPPYGCNLAAAGLLLSSYLGKRKDEIDIVLDGKVVSISDWLQKAMPENFFELSVLDRTLIVGVAEDRVATWERLLEQWLAEGTHSANRKYMSDAFKLEKTAPVPQQFRDRYEALKDRTRSYALRELDKFDNTMKEALTNISKGLDSGNVADISQGAVMLADQYERMLEEEECWSEEQFYEIAKHLEDAKSRIKVLFPRWLKGKVVRNAQEIGSYVNHMIDQVGANLGKIGLEEERRELVAHVDEVKRNVRRLEELERATQETQTFLSTASVSPDSRMTDLEEQLKKAEKLRDNLRAARTYAHLASFGSDQIMAKLEEFIERCNKQIQQHKAGTGDVYNYRKITSLSDIHVWKSEVKRYIDIFAGRERDVEDFRLVLKQLDLFEEHYQRLANMDLAEDELSYIFEQCKTAMKDAFSDDSPPLDSDPIYDDILKIIHEKRHAFAADWMSQVFEDSLDVESLDATGVLELKRQLEKMPPVLSENQAAMVQKKLEACERRLDDLEVEGLLARFYELSEKNRVRFIEELKEYFEALGMGPAASHGSDAQSLIEHKA